MHEPYTHRGENSPIDGPKDPTITRRGLFGLVASAVAVGALTSCGERTSATGETQSATTKTTPSATETSQSAEPSAQAPEIDYHREWVITDEDLKTLKEDWPRMEHQDKIEFVRDFISRQPGSRFDIEEFEKIIGGSRDRDRYGGVVGPQVLYMLEIITTMSRDKESLNSIGMNSDELAMRLIEGVSIEGADVADTSKVIQEGRKPIVPIIYLGSSDTDGLDPSGVNVIRNIFCLIDRGNYEKEVAMVTTGHSSGQLFALDIMPFKQYETYYQK